MRRFAFAAATAAACSLTAGMLSATQAGWTLVPTRTFPASRSGHAAAYDPVSAKMVIFGGDNKLGYLADTWVFNGTAWSKLNTKAAPSKRTGAGMAYDEITQQLVLFGGFDGKNRLGDTWLFDGAKGTWTQANPQSSPPAGNGAIVFTDPLTGHVIVYGGYGGQFYSNETWQWTGTDWVELDPAGVPGARSASFAAYDPIHNNNVMFCGLAAINVCDTWTWDGTNWNLGNPAVQPDPRFGSAAAFSPAAGLVILFGGISGTYVGDTWSWDGSNWAPVPTSNAPAPRAYHSLVYYPPTGQLVLFGGLSGSRALPDTWTYTP